MNHRHVLDDKFVRKGVGVTHEKEDRTIATSMPS